MNYIAPRWIAGGAVILPIASLALFWPGIAMYDTVAQYRQMSTGVFDDWHPPVMARLWALLAPLGPGATPMLVLQLTLYWAGLGTLATTLARIGRMRSAVAILAVGVLPPFLGWQGVVLKDAQMTGALLAVIGIVSAARLRDRSVPRAGWIAVSLLVGYAVLVRANALFATIPLMVMLAPRPTRISAKALTVVLATIGVLLVSPIINHAVLSADRSGVERTQALYDLAGIAVRVPKADDTGLRPAEVDTLVARRCVSPFFWDPLGEDTHCGPIMARLRALPVGQLYALLLRSAVHHPLAYAGHRLAHLNSTDRWLVPRGWIGAAPPAASEPNTLGLGDAGPAGKTWQSVAASIVETPLGWPVAWIVAAIVALAVAAERPATGPRDMAIALSVSALAQEASFAVLSIASDFRYHLWAAIATAVALVLLADRKPPRRTMLAGIAAMLVVIGGSVAARGLLPRPPQTYAGMLG